MERALVLGEHRFGKDHFKIAKDLKELGDTENVLGNYEKAKVLLERALVISKNVSSSNNVFVARILKSLGHTHAGLGQNKKVLELFLLCLILVSIAIVQLQWLVKS